MDMEIVYIMVELRKLLDRETEVNGRRFPLIRFYADWVVHTQKDKITKEIQNIMSKIDELMPQKPFPECATADIDFLYFPELRSEMEELFEYFNFPKKLFLHDNFYWINFINTLTQVLVNQPMNTPRSKLRSIKGNAL